MEKEPSQEQSTERTRPELEARPESHGPEHTQESEADRSRNVESARAKIESQPAAEKHEAGSEHSSRRFASGIDRKAAYAHTMASIQHHLPTASRAFSKVIHNPAVEKTSEAVGKTVMRPSVTLGATSTAVLVGGFTYFLAKHYGYAISGSTILLSLLIGGIVGALLELIVKLFRPKN